MHKGKFLIKIACSIAALKRVELRKINRVTLSKLTYFYLSIMEHKPPHSHLHNLPADKIRRDGFDPLSTHKTTKWTSCQTFLDLTGNCKSLCNRARVYQLQSPLSRAGLFATITFSIGLSMLSLLSQFPTILIETSLEIVDHPSFNACKMQPHYAIVWPSLN